MNDILWADTTLERVTVDYDAAVLRVRESSGGVKTLRCEGHIGVALDGFWDEVVVDRAEMVAAHAAIERAVSSISRRLGESWSETGNEHRNMRNWQALIVHLSDGCVLEVVASHFRVE